MNERRPHTALGYRIPNQFAKEIPDEVLGASTPDRPEFIIRRTPQPMEGQNALAPVRTVQPAPGSLLRAPS